MKNFNFSYSLIIISIILLSDFNNSFGQSVAINGNGAPADPQAILDVSSDTKGVLLPRVADHTSITPSTGSDDGLVVYDTGTDSYWYWDGSSWQEIPNTNDIPSVSLDDAYNAGRIIIADAGAVEINNTGGLLVSGNVGLGVTAAARKLHVQVTEAGGQSFPLFIRNQGAVNSGQTGVGIAFNMDNAGNNVKNAIYYERTADYSRGKLHFLMRNSGDNTEVDISTDSRLTILSAGNVGIGDVTPDAKLDVDAASGNLLILAQSGTERMRVDASGNAWITGKFNSNGIEELSDARYKKNIEKLNGVLKNVLKIQGVTYNWRQDEFPERSFGSKTEIGFIAQDLEKIYPELVNTNDEGYKSVQYSHMVPVLLEAIKEQQGLIEHLTRRLDDSAIQYSELQSKFQAFSIEMGRLISDQRSDEQKELDQKAIQEKNKSLTK